MLLNRFALALALSAMFAAGADKSATSPNTRNDSWRVIGPGGGGAEYMPTLSPHDPNTVLVGCDMTGAYLTRDGGKNWRMINLRGTPRFFVYDPSNPKTIYIKTTALWRSTDTGSTWQLVHPDPATVTGIQYRGDEAGERLQSSGPEESITALAVDPSDSRSLYAVFNAGSSRSLRKSSDSGKTWTVLPGEVAPGLVRILIDPHSPVKSRTVYTVAGDRITVLENGVPRTGPVVPEQFIDISGGFAPHASRPIIYAVTRTGLYVSHDGQTWINSKPAYRLQAVATSAHHPEVAYLSYARLSESGPLVLGVARTADSGATWNYVWKESEKKSPTVDNGWVSDRFGPGWGEAPIALGVAPSNPNICYGTDLGRTLHTFDGGANWIAAYTRPGPEGGWTTTGLDVTTNYGVHFDPFDPKHVFISYTDIGLFASEDGGATWQSATVSGVPREWLNTTYWLAFDPEVRGRMWAVVGPVHDLPRTKMWRRASPSSYKGGVVRSDDGGKTWRPMTNGMPQTAATHILVDPRSNPESRTLYVAGFGKGVFRSTDGGNTWQLKNNGLPQVEPFVWRLSQDRDGALYAVIARRATDATVGTDLDGALYRSKNGAESWEKVPLPAGVNGPNGLAIDPEDPKRLYLAAWRRAAGEDNAGGGIYLSTDAGATWRQVLSKDQYVYDVTIDPLNKAVLYAAGFQSSAWRSADSGVTWKRIRGYNFKWGHRVIPDPRDPSKIFVTTFGGSVWYGPAMGDPTAVEDIVTPVAAYSR